MKRCIVFMAVVFCALIFCACTAAPVSIPELTVQKNESFSQTIRQHLWDADLVISGECVATHINVDGLPCSDVQIVDILAGNGELGGVIHCAEASMKTGRQYLLYLGSPSDNFHTEDGAEFRIITDKPLQINNGEVKWADAAISVEEIKRNIEELSSVISSYSQEYYYAQLEQVVEAADDIFVGQVLDVPPLEPTVFRSQAGGASVEKTMPASISKIRAYGSIKGAFKPGDTLNLIYAPDMAAGVMDAATLKTLSAKPAVNLRKGAFYLFFLVDGPDLKQDYLFMLNPIQGAIEINYGNDELIALPSNQAAYGYRTLTDMVIRIKEEINKIPAG